MATLRQYFYFLLLVWLFSPGAAHAASSCGASGATIISSVETSTCPLAAGESLTITGTGGIAVSGGAGVSASGGITVGGVSNDGSISGASRGIQIDNGATVTGGISNTGTITTAGHGIEIGTAATSYVGANGDGIAIYNSGSIVTSYVGWGNESAISIWKGSIISGDIVNASSGTLSGAMRGINFDTATTTLNGDIINDGAISGGVYGVYNAGKITGAIINDGTISGNGNAGIYNAGAIGVMANGGSVYGGYYGIVNDTGGLIAEVVNTGTIEGAYYAIYNNGTITDGITNSGTLDGAVYLGTASLTLTGNSANVSGDITGSSSSSITVKGDFAASADATVGSISIVGGGSLSIGSGLTWTASNGTVSVGDSSGDGTLILNGGVIGADHVDLGTSGSSVVVKADTSLSAVIEGSGSILVQSGTLALTGENTYTGVTSIAAGSTLALFGTGGIANSSSVTANGVFDVSSTDSGASIKSLTGTGAVALGTRTLTLTNAAGTFSGTITGTGGLAIAGGTEVLTGDNTYTGGTSIAIGAALQLGNGDTTGSITGNVINDGTLAFDRSDDVTFAGVISGSGLLRQIGSGTLTLTGDNSAFVGTTEVASGTLEVSGSLGGTLSVLSDGTLTGTGTVGSTTVASGGTLSPGGSGSIGTLTISGNLSLASGSAYVVNVNAAGQSDLLHVGGVATLGGAVASLAADGNWNISTTYTIVTADSGVSGAFSGITSNFAFLTPNLSYDANNVYLTLLRNDVSFASIGITRNEQATGAALDSLQGGELANAVVQLSAPDARGAFSQLSGELYASLKGALIDDSRFVRDAANDRIRASFGGKQGSFAMAYADDGQVMTVPATTDRLAFWIQGSGSWGQRNGDGNAAGFKRDISGVLIGADAPVLDSWRFGALGGYSRSTFSAGAQHGSGTSDTYTAGLYGGTLWGLLGLRFGAAYGWSDIATGRGIAFTGFSDRLSANEHAGTAQIFGELGYRIDAGRTPFGQLSFEPFAGLAYVNVHTGGFTERGAAAALSSESDDTGVSFSTIGLRASNGFSLGGVDLSATGTLGWRHAYGDVTPTSTLRFAASSFFTVAGVPIARDAALVEAGLSTAITRDVSLSVSYIGQFGDGAQDQGARANLNWKF